MEEIHVQTGIVLNHLTKYGKITSMEAIQLYGITRLAAVIFILRKEYKIRTVKTEGVNRYNRVVKFATYYFDGKKET